MAAPPSIFDRCWLIWSLAEIGRFAEAAEPAAEAIRLAALTQHPFTVGVAHITAGRVHLLRGDWAQARPLIEHGTAVLRAGSVGLLLPQSVAHSAWVLAQLGEASEALSRLRESEQLVERLAASGYVVGLGWLYLSLGRAALVLGRLDDARRLGDRALESSSRQPGFAAHALHLLADIATHPDRFDAERGRAYYRQALGLAEPRGMRPLVAHCRLGLGRLDGRAEQREQAHGHLTTATTMYREMGMTYWLEQAEAELKVLQ
jgi:tetratricopeptide (TPR) repeat protein